MFYQWNSADTGINGLKIQVPFCIICWLFPLGSWIAGTDDLKISPQVGDSSIPQSGPLHFFAYNSANRTWSDSVPRKTWITPSRERQRSSSSSPLLIRVASVHELKGVEMSWKSKRMEDPSRQGEAWLVAHISDDS
jgi:hypothetical protein